MHIYRHGTNVMFDERLSGYHFWSATKKPSRRAVCFNPQLLSQVGSAVIGIIGAVCLVSTVNWLGKRFLSLVALAGNGVSCLLLGVYSYVVLRPGGATQYEAAWLPLSLIVVLSFCSSVMFEVPWMMLSEVFPFRCGENLRSWRFQWNDLVTTRNRFSFLQNSRDRERLLSGHVLCLSVRVLEDVPWHGAVTAHPRGVLTVRCCQRGRIHLCVLQNAPNGRQISSRDWRIFQRAE